eukprot:TRINITY_DN93830_c0_g1_i1.p1 TRINITY_DN93830_c0_g1~~TRINITY_DN93830_c0_g1_i1.p1  ORF type:complete len:883 (-),score=191.19 TRINITY_DN93830_c0_g1_i1:47-2695(-)
MRCVLASLLILLHLTGTTAGKVRSLSQHYLLAAQEPSENISKRLAQDAESTLDGVEKLQDGSAFKDDAEEFKDTFLNGWLPSMTRLFESLALVIVGAGWLAAYINKYYENDRGHIRLDGDQSPPKHAACRYAGALPQAPDMVFVFYHPDAPLGDEDTKMTNAQVEKLRMTEDLAGKQSHAEPQQKLTRSTSLIETIKDHLQDSSSVTRGEMRETLLKTLCAGLPKWGFDTSIFSSVDGDEIFVCVSLQRPEVIDHLLVKGNVSLPVSPAVVERLGIEQPQDDPASAPPLLRYDLRTVEHLHKSGVLSTNKPEELYSQIPFNGASAVSKSGLLNGVLRSRLISKELNHHPNLEAAVEEKLMVSYYVAHEPDLLDELTAETRTVGGDVKHLSMPGTITQPIAALEHYFGSRLAFIFAWNSTYCKAILGLVPIAVAMKLLVLLVHISGGRISFGEQFLGFAILLSAWARLAFNLWSREEAFFKTLWETDSEDRLLRPQFRGVLKPSPIDAKLLEPESIDEYATLWRLLSQFSTMAFCATVGIAIYTWNNVFAGNMNIFASICLSVQIIVFQAVYNALVELFLDLENHKWQADYYNSYLWKQFGFQCVNRYAPFFFLMLRGSKTGCATPDACLAVLQRQLVTTLVVLSICEIVTAVIAAAKAKALLWKEERDLEQMGLQHKRSFVEEQAKYATYRIREQVESMVQLVLSLGFVLLFGAVEPLAVPLCFAVFYVQLRASGFMLCHFAQRPFPRRLNGIGAWQDAVKTLMQLGVVTSGFLMTIHGKTFEGADILARMTGFCIVCVVMGAVWLLVDQVFPPWDGSDKLLSSRRRHVQTRILNWGNPMPTVSAAETAHTNSPVELAGELADAVCDGRWKEIPRSDGTRDD